MFADEYSCNGMRTRCRNIKFYWHRCNTAIKFHRRIPGYIQWTRNGLKPFRVNRNTWIFSDATDFRVVNVNFCLDKFANSVCIWVKQDCLCGNLFMYTDCIDQWVEWRRPAHLHLDLWDQEFYLKWRLWTRTL